MIGYSAIIYGNVVKIHDDNLKYLSLIKSRFIEDITLIDKYSSCPPNYELLIFGNTPKLEWCNNDKDNKGKKLSTYSCTLQQSSFSVYIWRSSKFCLKRSIYNYYNSTIIKTNLQCPNNYFDCGVIDSLNNKLCLPSNSSCPIKYISIIPNNTLINYTFDYRMQDFSDKKKILITSNDTKLNMTAITNLNYNKGNQCSNYNENGLDKEKLPNYNIYFYGKPCESSISNTKYNPYYFKIDSLDGDTICVEHLECKTFPFYREDNFLYYSTSPVVNSNCINRLTDNLISDSSKFSSQILSSLIICCLGTLTFIFSILNICFLNNMPEKAVKIFTSIIIMFLLSELVVLIFTFSLKKNNFFESFQLFSKKELCLDNYLTLLFIKLKKISYDPMVNLFVLEISFCLIQLLVYAGNLIIFSKITKEYQNIQNTTPYLCSFCKSCQD